MSRTRYSSPPTHSTETEVDLRINTLIPVNHRIPAGGANKQALVKASSTNRDVEWFSFTTSSVINVTDISLNDQVRAPTQRATALAIQGAIGTGSDNNYVDDITHSFSGQDLTLTLSRSGGLIDLFEVITIPSTGGGVALSDDDQRSTVGMRPRTARASRPRMGLAEITVTR